MASYSNGCYVYQMITQHHVHRNLTSERVVEVEDMAARWSITKRRYCSSAVVQLANLLVVIIVDALTQFIVSTRIITLLDVVGFERPVHVISKNYSLDG